jgi:hypothetical protein
MKTFDELKIMLSSDLYNIKKFEGNWPTSRLRRNLFEQKMGQHCYEAEEALNSQELALLKKTLGIEETRWRAYKMRFISIIPG